MITFWLVTISESSESFTYCLVKCKLRIKYFPKVFWQCQQDETRIQNFNIFLNTELNKMEWAHKFNSCFLFKFGILKRIFLLLVL